MDKNSPSAPIEEEYFVIKVPPTGLYTTSTFLGTGYAQDQFYHYSGNTLRKRTEPLSGAGFTEMSKNAPEEIKSIFIFIGTPQQGEERLRSDKETEIKPGNHNKLEAN
jgi:hypothetical protein